MNAFEPYLPLNTPKLFGNGVWIVDGPEIAMDYGPFTLPFPTRMVLAKLTSGELWVHSPIAPDPQLIEAVRALGPVRYLVAPNSLHYWYMADWLERFPQAESHAVPDLAKKAKRPFRIDRLLDGSSRPEFEEEIGWVLVPGTAVSEAVFHVRHASTVILTDLIENFERERIRRWWHRVLVRLGGADGGTPRDLRLTFRPKKREVAKQVAQIVEWRPDKVIMAHGRPIGEGGAQVLQRELGWAL